MSSAESQIGTGTLGLEDAEPDGSRPVIRGPILRQLLAVLVGVLVGMVLVDQLVVWWDIDQEGDDENRPIMQHEHIGWVNRPHFVNPEFETELDRFGLRNPEIPEDCPPDEVRLVGFGASRTFGAGGAMQSWCWNYALEELLAGRGFRVLNGGVSGYSLLQSCRRAEAYLDPLEPDLVFVVASPGAQLMLDSSLARRWVRAGDDSDEMIPADVVEGWPEALVPLVIDAHRYLNSVSGIYRRHRAKFQTGGNRVASVQRWMVSRDEPSEVAAQMLSATLDEAQALGAACAERGIELRILVLPEIWQDSAVTWRSFLRRNQQAGAPPVDTPRREPTTVLEELLQERGLATWNFFDEVDRMGRDRERFVMGDNHHWSKAGHEVIARGIVERLREEGLLQSLRERRAAAPRTRPFGENPFPDTGADGSRTP
ncbi:SGNH/GDSL hydrolase family protein [Engelhardtia mirabilis]|uniref:AlgX/AlgJ SGNH hydrolase-like domain-containing protein n=1 Tax=Engelhardtia mirabilis TaxID=2528011 RepID=A0A518BHJ2_9BACT|nr:hypothetical protein Pla133_14960 [Planctomycetes bacterium Pla133]QDV00750.1 hypothetical protein Pla86_14950 [Planctomycetes bacterium Pla86]